MAGFQTQELKHLLEGYLAEGWWGVWDIFPPSTKQTQRANKNLITHNKTINSRNSILLSICSPTTGDQTILCASDPSANPNPDRCV